MLLVLTVNACCVEISEFTCWTAWRTAALSVWTQHGQYNERTMALLADCMRLGACSAFRPTVTSEYDWQTDWRATTKPPPYIHSPILIGAVTLPGTTLWRPIRRTRSSCASQENLLQYVDCLWRRVTYWNA